MDIYKKSLEEDNIDKERNTSSIQITRRKSKFNLNCLNKILLLLLYLILIGSLAFSIFINIKYKKMFEEVQNKVSEGNVVADYSDVIDIVRKSLVTIGESKENLQSNNYAESNSTGVIVEKTGKILVNYSKIKDLKEIYVKLPFVGIEPIKAEVRVTNKEMDIAIIKVNYKDELTPIKFSDEDYKIEGKPIVLISNSASSEYVDSIIPGVIISTNRYIIQSNRKYNLIESNIPINKLNLGGVIVNLKGELVAVPSERITKEFNIEGAYYSLDMTSLGKVANYINQIKEILGISEGGFIDENIEGYTVGLYIAKLKDDSTLSENSLKNMDILLEIDGVKVSNSYEVLKNKKFGDTIKCKIIRDGELKDIDMVLE